MSMDKQQKIWIFICLDGVFFGKNEEKAFIERPNVVYIEWKEEVLLQG